MDLRDNKGYSLDALVCVLCGEIVDPLILQNRGNGSVLPRAREARRLGRPLKRAGARLFAAPSSARNPAPNAGSKKKLKP